MKKIITVLIKIALFGFTLCIWSWAYGAQLPNNLNLSIIIGAVLLVFPLVWLGRKILDKQVTTNGMAWTTTFVHFALMVLFGLAIVRAIPTYRDWIGWRFPIPVEIGSLLVKITGIATLLTVLNLAIRGLGAPFAIALSQKLASDWMYAWTRNPMVLSTLALLLSLGIWFQSTLFVLWVLVLVSPAWLYFVKVYEERELEFRFGSSYLEYKAKTPLLFPRKPRK